MYGTADTHTNSYAQLMHDLVDRAVMSPRGMLLRTNNVEFGEQEIRFDSSRKPLAEFLSCVTHFGISTARLVGFKSFFFLFFDEVKPRRNNKFLALPCDLPP